MCVYVSVCFFLSVRGGPIKLCIQNKKKLKTCYYGTASPFYGAGQKSNLLSFNVSAAEGLVSVFLFFLFVFFSFSSS